MHATNQEQSPADKINAWAQERGVTLRTEFIPFSKSRHAKPDNGEAAWRNKPWRSLNWRCWLVIDSRDVFGPTDYAAGEAHAPSYKLTYRDSIDGRKAIDFELEHGHGYRGALGKGEAIMPDLCDVLASLASDASVIEEGPFEEWASALGYDPDSRKAEATYRACLDTATALIRAFGMDGLKALQEAAADY